MKLKDIKDGNSLLIDMIVDIYKLHPLTLLQITGWLNVEHLLVE